MKTLPKFQYKEIVKRARNEAAVLPIFPGL
jgi:hypothetical protein